MTKPSGPRLIALAKLLQCSPEWLVNGTEPTDTDRSNAVWLGDVEPWDSKTPLGGDEVELPFFSGVELAAGSGSCQVIEMHGPKLRFSKSTLRRKNVDPANAACVTVSGNSMEPVIPEGSTIGIDTSQTTVSDGALYAIDNDGWLRIKRLYRIPGGIRVNSYNQLEHPDETYTGENATKIRIIGRVFWYSVLL
ncbi:MAG: helix-turn-helix transcriptional regulator [Oceanobacter sp.]